MIKLREIDGFKKNPEFFVPLLLLLIQKQYFLHVPTDSKFLHTKTFEWEEDTETKKNMITLYIKIVLCFCPRCSRLPSDAGQTSY